MSLNHTTYKQQLLLKLKKIQEEIAILAEREKELDSQLKIRYEKLQQDIFLGKAEIEALKARNKIKKQALKSKDLEFCTVDNETLKVPSKPYKHIRSKSKKEIGWELAYNYSRNHSNTPILDRNKLNSWVQAITKNCARDIRQINQCILAGNLKELEKLTGSTLVEKVSNYVNNLVTNIEELASFFNMLGEISAVHTAFKMIVEEFKTTGFYEKKQTKSYKNYSRHRKASNRSRKQITKTDFPLFRNCKSLKEAKEIRKRLSLENHPDLGGSEDKMKQINHQFDLFVLWIEKSA